MERNQAEFTGLTNKNHRRGEVEKDLWGAPSSTPPRVRENGDKTKITQNQWREQAQDPSGKRKTSSIAAQLLCT